MDEALQHGSEIIIHNWIQLQPRERLLVISEQKYEAEANALVETALFVTARADILWLDDLSAQVGTYFDDREKAFDAYDAIIGATEYSLITTAAVKRAISLKKRFLSLPLSTNDGRSMLTYDFLDMDIRKSRNMANVIMGRYAKASKVDITTDAGTNLHFRIHGRKAGFFNGCCRDGKGLSSASVEVYVALEEDKTEGTLVLDGSMGYIGTVNEPVHIELHQGRIVRIEDNPSGQRLKEFLTRYGDERMLIAGELGIGLNTHARCCGNCYIEDESAYGTFHIGFGRNLALGGLQQAKGHYDLVTHSPTILVDNRMIMDHGALTVLEPQIYF